MPETQNHSEERTAVQEFLAYTNALARREQKFSNRDVGTRALAACGDGSLYPDMRLAILEETVSVQDRNMPRTEIARKKALLAAALRAIDDEHKVPEYVHIRLLFMPHGIFNRQDYDRTSALLDQECGAVFSPNEGVANIAFLEMGVAPGDLYKRKFNQAFAVSRSFRRAHALAFLVSNLGKKLTDVQDEQIERLCEIFDRDFTPGRIINRTINPEKAILALYWLLMGKYDSFLRQGYALQPEIEPGEKPPKSPEVKRQPFDLEEYKRAFKAENLILRKYQQLRDPKISARIVEIVRKAEAAKRPTRIFSFFGFAHQGLVQSLPKGIQQTTTSTVHRLTNPSEEIIILLNQGEPVNDHLWERAFLYNRKMARQMR